MQWIRIPPVGDVTGLVHGSGLSMMKDIVHRHGNLFAHLLEKFQVRFTIGFFLQTQKSHRAQPPHRSRQGNNAKRVHAVLAHVFSDLRPATFFGKIGNEDRLLRLPDQSGGTLFDRPFMATHEIGRHVRLNGVQSHRVSNRIVQRQGDKIHMDDPRQALGKGLERVRGDRGVRRSPSATSSRAGTAPREYLQGDADCLIHRRQYGLLIVAAQELPAAPVAEAGLIWMLEALVACEVSSQAFTEPSIGYFSMSNPSFFHQRQPPSSSITG